MNEDIILESITLPQLDFVCTGIVLSQIYAPFSSPVTSRQVATGIMKGKLFGRIHQQNGS